MSIIPGRRRNPKRFSYLDRWTSKKKKSNDNPEADAPFDRIVVTRKVKTDTEPAPKKITESAPVRVSTASADEQPSVRISSAPPKEPSSIRVGPGAPEEPPPASPPPKRRRRRPFLRLIQISALLLLISFTLLMGAALQILRDYITHLPALEELERYRPMLVSRLYCDNQELIGEYMRERRKLIPIQEIPEALIHAVVAREDKNFFRHFGVDPEGIARAAYVNIKARRIKEGGSTITQQMVKILTNQREKVLTRKIKEALLAIKVERTYSKQEILEIYLNQVNFGHGWYGVGAAAEMYFGKEVKDLNVNESAMLAGLIQLPNVHSPFRNPERARLRRLSVLRRMVDQNYITEQEFEEYSKQPLQLATRRQEQRQKNLAPHFYEYVRLSIGHEGDSGNTTLPHTLETKALGHIGEQRLYSDGLSIKSTLNFEMQQIAQQAVTEGLHRIEQVRRKYPSHWGEPPERRTINRTLRDDGIYNARIVRGYADGAIEVELPEVTAARGRYTVPIDLEKTWLDDFGVLDVDYWLQVRAHKTPDDNWRFTQSPESHIQGCLVALEAETGKILALVGGYDFFEDHPGAKIIYPVQALLQPGSSFKPILYAYALHQGMTPSDTIDELPLEYRTGGTTWRVQNFESSIGRPELHGETPLRRALVKSMNIASVHLWNRLSNNNRDPVVSVFSRENMGIQSPVTEVRASALGVSELYPIELAAAFAIFANGGRRIRPYAIERVTDHFGNVLAQQFPVSEPFLRDPKRSAQIAYQMTHMLRGTLEDPEGTAFRSMTELYPQGFPFPIAGKTGTNNDCAGAWFAGYNPQIVTVVWVGFERKKSLGVLMTGSRTALPIWADFMEKAIPIYHASRTLAEGERGPELDFPVPPGLVFVEVCQKSGGLANVHCRAIRRTVQEAFIPGTEPQRPCTYHGLDKMDAFDNFLIQRITQGRPASRRYAF